MVGMMTRWAVVSDFDGSFTEMDGAVGLLDHYTDVDWRKLDDLFDTDEITLRILMEKEADMLNCTRSEMIEFALKNMIVRKGAVEFIKLCQERSIPVTIASEGFVDYIEKILEREGLEGVTVHANRLIWEDKLIVGLSHPSGSEDCDKCGTCKENIVKEYQAQGYKVVYIGDGISDLCGSRVADKRFARDRLAKDLGKKGMEFTPFEDFHLISEFVRSNPS